METTLEMVMGLAEEEVKKYVYSIMKKNNIPYGVMMYVLKSVQYDLAENSIFAMNNRFLDLQIKLSNSKKEVKNGNPIPKGSVQ